MRFPCFLIPVVLLSILTSEAGLSEDRPEPHQVNLAADPKHAEKRKELEALLKAEMERLDDPYKLSGYQ